MRKHVFVSLEDGTGIDIMYLKPRKNKYKMFTPHQLQPPKKLVVYGGYVNAVNKKGNIIILITINYIGVFQ